MSANITNNRKGFSFVELMIVVAIIGILATVAIPAYFNHILRSRQVEGANRLLDIKNAQEKYYVLNDVYYTVGNMAVANTEFRGMVNFDVADTSIYRYTLTSPGGVAVDFLALAQNDLNEDGVRKDCWTISSTQTEPVINTTAPCAVDGEDLSLSLLPF